MQFPDFSCQIVRFLKGIIMILYYNLLSRFPAAFQLGTIL